MQKLSNTLFCAVICILMFAGVQPVYGEKTPEEILHEAEQFSGHVSYSADSCEEDGRISQKKYVKVNPDGSRWTRLQGIDIDDMYTIMNDSGKYSVFGNTAVKAPPRKLPPIKRSPDGKPRKTTLTIAEGEWDGKPCYIITETVELSDYKTVYRIGKEDNFIYSRKMFEIDSGKLFSSTNYTNVVLNPDLPDDLFSLPENAEIKIPADFEEETSMISEAIIVRHTTPASVDANSLDKPVPVRKIIYICVAVFIFLGLVLSVIVTVRHSKLSDRQ